MSDASLYINGLAATRVRLRLFAAVRVPGRIYREPGGEIYDRVTGYDADGHAESLAEQAADRG